MTHLPFDERSGISGDGMSGMLTLVGKPLSPNALSPEKVRLDAAGGESDAG